MEYTKVGLYGLKWMVPVQIADLSIPERIDYESYFNPTHTERGSENYVKTLFPSFFPNHPEAPVLRGGIIVDLCSGTGNLDEFMRQTKAKKMIRVDRRYSKWYDVEFIEMESDMKGKYEFNKSSIFSLDIESGISDLTMESHGTFHYMSEIVLGLRDYDPPIDGFDCLETEQLLRIQSGLYTFFRGLSEMMRITKKGGSIRVSKFCDGNPQFIYEELLKPQLDSMESDGILVAEKIPVNDSNSRFMLAISMKEDVSDLLDTP